MDKKIAVILVIIAIVLVVIALAVSLQSPGSNVRVPTNVYSKQEDTSLGRIGVDVIPVNAEDK